MNKHRVGKGWKVGFHSNAGVAFLFPHRFRDKTTKKNCSCFFFFFNQSKIFESQLCSGLKWVARSKPGGSSDRISTRITSIHFLFYLIIKTATCSFKICPLPYIVMLAEWDLNKKKTKIMEDVSISVALARLHRALIHRWLVYQPTYTDLHWALRITRSPLARRRFSTDWALKRAYY